MAGYFVNFLSLLFLSLGIVMICFPAAPHPSPASFNWTVVIFSGVTIFALVYYVVYGHGHYVSPRSRITQFKLVNRIEQGEIGPASKTTEVYVTAEEVLRK